MPLNARHDEGLPTLAPRSAGTAGAVRAAGLLTVGHGAASSGELAALLQDAGAKLVVDIRSVPGSRRNPQFGRAELEAWMHATGLGYRWEPDLGGFRRSGADSPNVALRHPSFRGYADYMATDRFSDALGRLLNTDLDAGTVRWDGAVVGPTGRRRFGG